MKKFGKFSYSLLRSFSNYNKKQISFLKSSSLFTLSKLDSTSRLSSKIFNLPRFNSKNFSTSSSSTDQNTKDIKDLGSNEEVIKYFDTGAKITKRID